MSVDTQLSAARTAYGRELIAVYGHPREEHAARIREILARYRATRTEIQGGARG